MNWFKQHTDTALVLGAILSAVLWMNGQFNDLKRDNAVIKTVLIMKGIMPSDLPMSQDHN